VRGDLLHAGRHGHQDHPELNELLDVLPATEGAEAERILPRLPDLRGAPHGQRLQPAVVGLLGTSTPSASTLDPAAAQSELTEGDKRALLLPGSEQGTWLEDVDTVTLTGWCESPSAVRIGFGRYVGTVRSAQPRQAAASTRSSCLRPFAACSTGAESMLGPLAHRQCSLRGWLETLCTLCLKPC
jgi:hypothetical protein